MESDIMQIRVERAAKTRINEVDFNNIPFGREFADHMFVADYANGKWSDFRIQPYGNMPFTPAMLALHYGQTIFEGMKAYRNSDGEVMMFRPTDNFKRLNLSAERMCMPVIPVELMMEALKELIKIDIDWVPEALNSSLYIRPFMFATDQFLGVKPSETYRCVMFTGPVGPYYTTPLKVMVESTYTRAAKGGTGSAKSGGNYGGSLYPTRLAQQKGYHQLLWTDAVEHKFIEESGTMNVMFQIGDTLVTPPTGDTILKGITRDSVLTLAADLGINVEERRISIDELAEAHKRGDLLDAFGVGTAATVAPIELIGYNGVDMVLRPIEEREMSALISKQLNAIRYGEVEDKFGWMVSMN
ncbi:MAG: branched-chain amino acid aminotransferase [Flavobacteriales bacterium]|nr:branched-chain amino acid aminotransferase [Flavobacteriales bacterium]